MTYLTIAGLMLWPTNFLFFESIDLLFIGVYRGCKNTVAQKSNGYWLLPK